MPDLSNALTVAGADLLALAPLLKLWQAVWPYLLMVLGFSIIIFVHELGHFAAAKWAGIKVERFAIGFGRELFGFTIGETRYSFNILPLGGYVKMLGQEDFDDKSNELLFSSDPRSFINKPVPHRMVVVSAGVVMNVLFAGLLFMIIFMVGMPAVTTRIGYVEPDSPADKAGILPGDRVISINGKRVLDFRVDLTTAVALAPPHERIEFRVEREGGAIEPIFVKPDFRRPESTKEIKRQVIGIAPGATREVSWIGPEVDPGRPDHPHVGDLVAEVDGTPVTNDNIDRVRELLPFAKDVYVERRDPKQPDAAPQRVKVTMPPQLALYPADGTDPASLSLLGLTPLARFFIVDTASRADIAGLEVGDTVLSFDDRPYPTHLQINQSIRNNPETDIPFIVRKSNGKAVRGFVRPKTNRFGAATLQAEWEEVQAPPGAVTPGPSDAGPSGEESTLRVTDVRPGGAADRAGLRTGDEILLAGGINRPTAAQFSGLVRRSAGRALQIKVRRDAAGILPISAIPVPPGAIDATFTLVANDVLHTAEIVKEIHGKPTPAGEANIPTGAAITSVEDEAVSSWTGLIDAFRRRAGRTVLLGYRDVKGKDHATPFRAPASLRTMLGVGPEARILSIDGRESVVIKKGREEEEVHVGYHEGTEFLLESLVGQTKVPVVYRPTPIADPVTQYIDVTADMTDPWLGRVAYAPAIDVAPELITLRGKNVLDAVAIGVHKTWSFILQVYLVIKRMVFSDTVGVENMSGPLGIVAVGGQIAQANFVQFLYFLAIISANLAVINFLPLPIMDGGLMVFLIIELIKGNPVSLRVQVATQMIGLFLIIGLFLFVTYNDVMRLWG